MKIVSIVRQRFRKVLNLSGIRNYFTSVSQNVFLQKSFYRYICQPDFCTTIYCGCMMQREKYFEKRTLRSAMSSASKSGLKECFYTAFESLYAIATSEKYFILCNVLLRV